MTMEQRARRRGAGSDDDEPPLDDARFRRQFSRRLKTLEASVEGRGYPRDENISFIARARDTVSFFLTDDAYSHSWFYPRYAGEKLHEPVAVDLLLEHLDADSVFVDVGAHLGYFSVIAAAVASKVFAIEAQEMMISRIHRNVCANHLNNVHIMLAAAGSAPGFAEFAKSAGPGGGVHSGSGNLVPVVRLDDYFTDDLMPTLIKIDTEGYEMNVLRGCTNILKNKVKLIIEVHQKMREFGDNPFEFYDLLVQHGYTVRSVSHRREGADLTELSRDDVAALNNYMVFCDPS